MSTLETPVGELASTVPGSTALFRRHHIDFCCGGGQTLAQACEKKGIDAAALAGQVEQLRSARDPSAADWTQRPLGDLVEHILANFHEKHRADLPELFRLASRVEAVHAGHPACPKGLAAALRETAGELDMHMQKEEEILFPMIRRGMGRMAEGPISVMNHEHDEHGERLRKLEALAHHFELPPDACNTWRATYAGVRALVDDVMEHIHLENNILFPRALGGER